jgi:quercetin dioxygenase-like cupin family protein
MTKLGVGDQIARRIDASHLKTIDVLGPTIQFLTPLEGGDDAPCLMRGTIPPGIAVPLHSHADPETFLMISGEVEALVEAEDGFDWVRIRLGDVLHAPGGAKHAFRNQGQEPTAMILVSTCRMGRFFRDVGRPVVSGIPTPLSEETIRHFLETADRHGYWNAPPEENARLGIALPVG